MKKRNIDYDNFNVKHWLYSDDKAKAHKALYHWLGWFLKTVEGVYGSVNANITAIAQVADDPLCNGYFKSNLRREGRNFMREEIIKSLNDDTERKQIIPDVSRVNMDKILSVVYDKINTAQGISNIRKAFKRKLCPEFYDKNMQKYLDLFDTIKHKPEEELFPDKINFWNNIKHQNGKYKNIPQVLLNYKSPEKAYLCVCGWMYSSRNKDRIQRHNKVCPINSYYGVVPAFEPRDTTDSNSYIQEFVGYKQRVDNGLCMFNLVGRWIEYTDDQKHDILTMIIHDDGNGCITTEDRTGHKRRHRLEYLRYRDTMRIWRNF